MILCISTSSSLCNVAFFSPKFQLLSSIQEEAKQSCGVKLPMLIEHSLAELNATIHDITKVVIDVGPGSFSGIKIGTTYAKILAYTRNVPICSISSFHLVDNINPVAIPIRSNLFLLKNPGSEEIVEHPSFPSNVKDVKGYGRDVQDSYYPLAENLAHCKEFICEENLFNINMQYKVMPNISTPKKSLF